MDNFFLNIALIVETLGFFVLNRWATKRFLNIAQVQNVIWLVAGFVYLTHTINYYSINVVVYYCAFLYLFGFNVAYLIFASKNLDNFSIPDFGESAISLGRKCCIFSLLAWMCSIPILQKSLPILFGYGDNGMNMLRWVTYGENSIFSTFDMCLMTYVIRPICTVTIILFAQQLAFRNVRASVTIAALADAMLLVLMTAGRAMMVSLVLYVTVALFFVNSGQLTKLVKQYKKYFVPICCVLVLILAVSTTRVNRDSGVLVELGIYYLSGMPYFSQLIDVGQATPFKYFGQATFAFLIDPFMLLGRLLGLGTLMASQDISNTTNVFLCVAPGISTNATASTLFPFYSDFGTIGCLLSGAILGWIAAHFEEKFLLSPDCLNFGRYLFLVVGFASSVQNYSFGNVATFFVWVFLFLLLSPSEQSHKKAAKMNDRVELKI